LLSEEWSEEKEVIMLGQIGELEKKKPVVV